MPALQLKEVQQQNAADEGRLRLRRPGGGKGDASERRRGLGGKRPHGRHDAQRTTLVVRLVLGRSTDRATAVRVSKQKFFSSLATAARNVDRKMMEAKNV